MLLPACAQAKDAWEGTKQSAQETKDVAADKVTGTPARRLRDNPGTLGSPADALLLQVESAKESAKETRDTAADKVGSGACVGAAMRGKCKSAVLQPCDLCHGVSSAAARDQRHAPSPGGVPLLPQLTPNTEEPAGYTGAPIGDADAVREYCHALPLPAGMIARGGGEGRSSCIVGVQW